MPGEAEEEHIVVARPAQEGQVAEETERTGKLVKLEPQTREAEAEGQEPPIRQVAPEAAAL